MGSNLAGEKKTGNFTKMPRPAKRKDITPIDPRSKRPEVERSDDQRSTLAVATSFFSALVGGTGDSGNTGGQSAATSRYSSTSNLSVGSSKTIDRQKLFEAKNYGKMRTMIEINVNTLNGEPLKTNVQPKLGYYICKRNLNILASNLHGIDMNWKGHPVFEVRLINEIDVDKLPAEFSFHEQAGPGLSDLVYGCTIQGVRAETNQDLRMQREEDPDEPWTRWVTIEGSGYSQKEVMVKAWLLKYGELLSDYEEETMTIIDEDPEVGEESEVVLGCGKFKVKMRIVEHIPQYLPMNGRKVRIYYRGINKVCTNCYQGGHNKQECENGRMTWVEYVSNFIDDNPDFEKEMFGRWIHITRRWKLEQTLTSTQTVVDSLSSTHITEENSRKATNEQARPTRVSDRVKAKQKQ